MELAAAYLLLLVQALRLRIHEGVHKVSMVLTSSSRRETHCRRGRRVEMVRSSFNCNCEAELVDLFLTILLTLHFSFLSFVINQTVMLFAGHGTHQDAFNRDGGDGGDIYLVAGRAHGQNKQTDKGGDVHITGGASKMASGGTLFIKSGPGEHGEGSSGNVNVSAIKS